MLIEKERDIAFQADWLEAGLHCLARHEADFTPGLCVELLDRRMPKLEVLLKHIFLARTLRMML